MAYIQVIEPEAAEGALQAEYSSAVERAGKVFNILKIPEPQCSRASRQHAPLSGHHARTLRSFQGRSGNAGHGGLSNQ